MKRACYNKLMVREVIKVLGGGCLGLALLMAFGVNAFAMDIDSEFMVDIDPETMLIIPSDPVNLNVNPTESGAFDSKSFDVFASTNSKYGYTLSMEVKKTYLEAPYPDADTGITDKIQAMTFVEGGISTNDFRNSTSEGVLNHWGVAVDGAGFNPINETATIKTTASTALRDKTTISVGAKVDSNAKVGTYSTTINFALVPNIVIKPEGVSGGDVAQASAGYGAGFEGGTLGRSYEVYYHDVLEKSIYIKDTEAPNGYRALEDGEITDGKGLYFAMQDMDPIICARVTKVPSEIQVIDLRDGKTYWIAKLADGKCWMTQNLDLDLVAGEVFTPDDTDVKQNWSPRYSTKNFDSLFASYMDSSVWTSGMNFANSVDFGDWYWIGNWERDGVSTWYSGTTNNYMNAEKGDPSKFQHETPYDGNGEHGHVGNYYNWAAAMATDVNRPYNEKEYGEMDTSICPKGWRLPRQGTDKDKDRNDYIALKRAYSIPGSDKILTAAPMYFVRGGYFDSSLYSPGYGGYYWVDYDYGDNGFALEFTGSETAVTYNLGKQYYASIRCIAR